jgi:excisionase family DNA binding protein
MNTTDETVSPGKAALILGVSVKTIDRWRQSGKLPTHGYTEGGHRRFLLADVERLAQERAA